jgi:hypothetical protein
VRPWQWSTPAVALTEGYSKKTSPGFAALRDRHPYAPWGEGARGPAPSGAGRGTRAGEGLFSWFLGAVVALECGSLLPLYSRELCSRLRSERHGGTPGRPASWPEERRQQAAALQSAWRTFMHSGEPEAHRIFALDQRSGGFSAACQAMPDAKPCWRELSSRYVIEVFGLIGFIGRKL